MFFRECRDKIQKRNSQNSPKTNKFHSSTSLMMTMKAQKNKPRHITKSRLFSFFVKKKKKERKKERKIETPLGCFWLFLKIHTVRRNLENTHNFTSQKQPFSFCRHLYWVVFFFFLKKPLSHCVYNFISVSYSWKGSEGQLNVWETSSVNVSWRQQFSLLWYTFFHGFCQM